MVLLNIFLNLLACSNLVEQHGWLQLVTVELLHATMVGAFGPSYACPVATPARHIRRCPLALRAAIAIPTTEWTFTPNVVAAEGAFLPLTRVEVAIRSFSAFPDAPLSIKRGS